ncbi:ABC transporter permease [Chungangia koreensis]|uniref:ABC transporter permease n=1 Tax=Chungangia koreensis TaxID=752657 RepID=A0ABV8XAZ5_9LACT
MPFKDQVDYIRQHMKKNRLRVFMTILAATMGCAFLIVLASVGFGLHKTIKEEMLSGQILTQIEMWGKEDGNITAEDVEAIKKKADVKAVVTRKYVDGNPIFHLEDYSGYGEMLLTDTEQEARAGLELAEGKMPEKSNEVVVGYHFAKNLLNKEEQAKRDNGEEVEFKGYSDDIIGKKIEVELRPFEPEDAPSKTWEFVITGIIKEPAKDWMTDTRMLVSDTWQSEISTFLSPEGEEATGYSSVNVYANDIENVKAISDQLKAEGFYVYSITEEMETMNLFFTVLKAGLLFVGTIAVLIASIGIFNTMTMAVTERTREIGIMKAVGAKPKLIQKLFLMESAWIGVLGTVLAIGISYGLSFLVNWLIPEIVMGILAEEGMEEINVTISLIPWQLVLIASAISIGVAMISGWRPARKATKIDVIRALRQEL